MTCSTVTTSLPLVANSGMYSATRRSMSRLPSPMSSHAALATNAFVAEKITKRVSRPASPTVSYAASRPSRASANLHDGSSPPSTSRRARVPSSSSRSVSTPTDSGSTTAVRVMPHEPPISWLVPLDEGAPLGRRGLVRFLDFGDWRERLPLLVAPLRRDEAPAALNEAEDADIPAVHFGHRGDADELHGLARLHLQVKLSRLEAVEVMPVEGRHHHSSTCEVSSTGARSLRGRNLGACGGDLTLTRSHLDTIRAMRRAGLTGAVVALVASCSSMHVASSAPATVTEIAGQQNLPVARVDPFAAQRIDGFGASGAWWPNDLVRFAPRVQRHVEDLLFSRRGIALSGYRYNIGGGGIGVHTPARAPQEEKTDTPGREFLRAADQKGVPVL